jgi:hypothetical protein
VKKTLLCTAVGATLAAVSGAASALYDVEPYQLIPYVVKDANRTTVVTVVAIYPASTGVSSIHLQYWTKSTTDANTAACQPNSVTIPVTVHDMMTFDTAGLLGYPLFGDTTNPAPLGASISYPAPRHGYLLLDGYQNGSASARMSQTYWLELDLANGGAHGDIGLMYDSTNAAMFTTPFNALYYNAVGDLDATDMATAVNFWPSSVASTVFTVTPLGTNMLTRENNQVILQVYNTNEVQGAYDRNENGVDGTVPVTVRCVGRVTPAQLMPGVAANAAWAAQGGWGFLANLGNGDTNYNEGQPNDLPVVIWQVDTTTAAGQGKFMINATEIVAIDI